MATRIRKPTKAKGSNTAGTVPQSIRTKVAHLVESQQQIEALQAEVKKLTADLEKYAKDNKLEKITGTHNTEFVQVVKKGRKTTNIDPRELYDHLQGHDQYFDCVKVQLTALRQQLSGYEIDKLATVTPGKETNVFIARIADDD